MRLFKTIAGLRADLGGTRPDRDLGLVPTMGALHAGHQSLVERARAENEVVVASIFVNPLQFGPQEDFQQYPRAIERDCQLCEQWGVDVVFAPSAQELGVWGNNTLVIPPAEMLSVLCGPRRPGHFQGVATIVTKLLAIAQPTRAYFGEKDAQQLAIIRRLVRDLNLPVEIRAVAIARDTSGVALSSRNQYLTPVEKEQAPILFRSLQAAKEEFNAGKRETSALLAPAKDKLTASPDVKLDYLEIVDPHTLRPLERIEVEGLVAIAAYLGSTRLIDNLLLRNRKPIIAIDGPAGAGKSTVTRRVARALGFLHLDTGAMYRAVTALVLEAGIDVEDEAAVAELLDSAAIEFRVPNTESGTRVFVGEQDITSTLRSSAITAHVSAVSRLPAVRQMLVAQQRNWGQKGGIVAEGRDIGTRVFPDAELKIFLTASVGERARRRLQDLKAQGEVEIDFERLEQDIQRRDFLDSTRSLSPLRKAPDAIELTTDSLSVEEATQAILALYEQSFVR
ncbi:MAG: bifunctional pantoate--beta-alanine ligase/(d)CMP kinase [Cyanobacteriota bacterium]|nr:bifunctional pantoate--beta-alanine ligase/(d)CMP kinase [Cyanobacteriota bacterium]